MNGEFIYHLYIYFAQLARMNGFEKLHDALKLALTRTLVTLKRLRYGILVFYGILVLDVGLALKELRNLNILSHCKHFSYLIMRMEINNTMGIRVIN